MKTFAQRLEAAKKSGLMTTADLATWFERAYPSVRNWLDGREPWGPNGDRARILLDLLEEQIKKKNGLPIPVQLSPTQRREHVKGLRRAINARLSRTYITA